MTERTLVPIFVFWAFLTIITPTLVLLSENSKQEFDSYGNYSMEVVADDRRMMGDSREYGIRKTTPPSATVVATEELTAAPAEAPTGANLTVAASSHNNGSHGSNKSDHHHGLTQVFPRKHLKQTKLQSVTVASS